MIRLEIGEKCYINSVIIERLNYSWYIVDGIKMRGIKRVSEIVKKVVSKFGAIKEVAKKFEKFYSVDVREEMIVADDLFIIEDNITPEIEDDVIQYEAETSISEMEYNAKNGLERTYFGIEDNTVTWLSRSSTFIRVDDYSYNDLLEFVLWNTHNDKNIVQMNKTVVPESFVDVRKAVAKIEEMTPVENIAIGLKSLFGSNVEYTEQEKKDLEMLRIRNEKIKEIDDRILENSQNVRKDILTRAYNILDKNDQLHLVHDQVLEELGLIEPPKKEKRIF